ncbi:MAG: hypothetical protein V4620_13105 [Bacteroidota bacterium]
MKNNHLNVDSEDLEDVLKEVEKLFHISFMDNELQHVKTFGDLCDAILAKINLPQKDDCTSQQAFYKLRNAITENIAIDKTEIKPEKYLKELFPRGVQINKIENIEKSLGFKLKILQVKRWIVLITIVGLVISLVTMFVNLYYGLEFAIILLALYFLILNKVREFKVNTIGEVVETMKQNNYFESRREQRTVNRKELVKVVEKYFIENLATDLKELNRDTVIV